MNTNRVINRRVPTEIGGWLMRWATLGNRVCFYGSPVNLKRAGERTGNLKKNVRLQCSERGNSCGVMKRCNISCIHLVASEKFGHCREIWILLCELFLGCKEIN